MKEEALEADRIVKDMEQKYHVTAEELDSTRRKLESAWLRNQKLELELKAALSNRAVSQQPVPRQMSMKKLSVMPSVEHLSEEEEEEEEEEDDEEDDSSDDGSSDASQELDEARRSARELKLLEVKLKAVRDKQTAALKERRTLKQALAKKQSEIKAEKKKYKMLQKEVDKMAKLMRETEDDEEEDEEDQEEEESEEASGVPEWWEELEGGMQRHVIFVIFVFCFARFQVSESSESEESDDEPKSEGEAPASATPEQKKENLCRRSKYYEGRLTSLKKGNYLLKANVERLQDDVNKQKEMSLVLQEDLNSVLAELG